MISTHMMNSFITCTSPPLQSYFMLRDHYTTNQANNKMRNQQTFSTIKYTADYYYFKPRINIEYTAVVLGTALTNCGSESKMMDEDKSARSCKPISVSCCWALRRFVSWGWQVNWLDPQLTDGSVVNEYRSPICTERDQYVTSMWADLVYWKPFLCKVR